MILMDQNTLKKIIKTIESSNINFLIGSGLSRPFLNTLNNIEKDLTEAWDDLKKVIPLKKDYFDGVMLWNISILENLSNHDKDLTLENYKKFYFALNKILLNRENSILTKQVNIFTTNIDIFSEKALEDIGIDFNDGFTGRFNPRFDLWNFKKSYFKKSLHYENTSEIPVFNLLKIHWSLNWKSKENSIILDGDLSLVKEIESVKHNETLFNDAYKKLLIVNPTKKKFEDTLLNEYYYSLLRIYSNELEKDNTVLFVMWFSFADEHIRNLTNRVAASNPTLKIYIIKYSPKEEDLTKKKPEDILLETMEKDAKNWNIELIYPEAWKKNSFEIIIDEMFNKICDNWYEQESNHIEHHSSPDDSPSNISVPESIKITKTNDVDLF